MFAAVATTTQPMLNTTAVRIMVAFNPRFATSRLIDAAAVMEPARYSAKVQLIRLSPPISSTALGMVVAVSIELEACSHSASAMMASFGRYCRVNSSRQEACGMVVDFIVGAASRYRGKAGILYAFMPHSPGF